MLPPAAAPETFINTINQIEDALDNVVDHGSDDELFTASYLQGHFAVIARQLEMEPDATIDRLDSEMRHSLNQAFANQELEGDDQGAVTRLWSRLLSQAS
ncbi:YfcL family protein [Alteromonas sp. H39]|uniref:YfcL family protein n=1 Tax=Alteromonas sp. H39 TaxID=3389876 RepID=UPI0039DF9821